ITPTEVLYPLSLHDALPISPQAVVLAVMDDNDVVEHVARQFVRRHGVSAVEVLRERADCCAEDYRSADAWRDIAEAARRLLSCEDRKSTRLNSSHLGISYAV